MAILVPRIGVATFTSGCDARSNKNQRWIELGSQRLQFGPVSSCICWRSHVWMIVAVAIIGLVVSQQVLDICSCPFAMERICIHGISRTKASHHGDELCCQSLTSNLLY